MARFAFLLFSLFLFALNPASADWHTDGAQISFPPKGYQVAQGGAAAQATRKRKIAKRSGIVVRKNASAWVETV